MIATNILDFPDPGDWIVLPESQKIDISIRSLKAGLLVFIENKIDAGEQETQLERYRQLLKQQSGIFPKGVLVFLTPNAYGSAKTGYPDIHFSYEKDIAPWLSEIEPEIEATKVRGSLQQYIDIVKNMGGDGAMATQKNLELIDLLKQPGNVLCALEISEQIDNVKNDLRLLFWEQVNSGLLDWISKSNFAAAWSVCGLDDLKRDPNANLAGVYLVCNNATNVGTQLQLGL